jgi:hypothetical protein
MEEEDCINCEDCNKGNLLYYDDGLASDFIKCDVTGEIIKYEDWKETAVDCKDYEED